MRNSSTRERERDRERAGLVMICLRMQPGRIDKLEPATGPPDYIPRSLSRMATEVTNAIVEPLPVYQYSTISSPWGTLLSSSSCDEGLGVALAGHKRPRTDVESSTSNWSELANLDIDRQARPWQPAAGNPLGEVVTRATESRLSPTGGAACYSSSPSWCSSDSGIQHSDICCKPYFSPPRSTNPGTSSSINARSQWPWL